MSTPFLALAPSIPRVVDVAYAAMTFPCVNAQDVSDETDVSDVSDETDGGGGGDVVI